MKRIAVIGGTGMTGQCVVDYALEKGLSVNLLYRNEETLPARFKTKVELIKGNALNIEDCKRVVEGVDGVCIVLGTRNQLAPTTEMSESTANLINAMKEKKVSRFSIVLSTFLLKPDNEVPPMFNNINNEHKKMLELTKSSGLEFIAVLPPHIADEPATAYTVSHNECKGRMISKYDLAKFCVESLSQPEHFGQICGVAKQA